MALTANQALPWLIDVDCAENPVSHVNWNTIGTSSTNALLNLFCDSSGAQNDETNFDVVLAAGTWTVEVMHIVASDRGTYSVQFDGVEKGTVDGYSASVTYNTRSSVTGVAVSTTAKVRLKLKMATKNASSSNYKGSITHIQLRRTA